MLQGLEVKEILDEWAAKYFPLTLWLAKQQQKRLPSGVEELDDLRGEASLALVSCLHGYDPSAGLLCPLGFLVGSEERSLTIYDVEFAMLSMRILWKRKGCLLLSISRPGARTETPREK